MTATGTTAHVEDAPSVGNPSATPRRSGDAWRDIWHGAVSVQRITTGELYRTRVIQIAFAIAVVAFLSLAIGGSEGVSAADRASMIRQGIVSIIQATTLVALAFTAAFLVPGDLESRRLLTLLTKPLSPGVYIIGRWLGLLTAAAMLIGVMGICGLVLLTVTHARESADIANRRPILPDTVRTWGRAQEARSLSHRNLPVRVLGDARECGMLATFTDLPSEDASAQTLPAESPGGTGFWLEFHTGLRLRLDRRMQEGEVVAVQVRPTGSMEAGYTTDVPLVSQTRQRAFIPWQGVVGQPRPPADLAGIEVIVSVGDVPYALALEPDSLAILAPASWQAGALGRALFAVWLRVAFVVGVVLLLSSVFTPYTALLGGFFANLVGGVSGTLAAQLRMFDRQLAFALERQADGVPIEPTMLAGKALLHDLGLGPVLQWAADSLPSFSRFHVIDQFVLGYDSAAATMLASGWYLGFWSVACVFVAVIVFSRRQFS